MEGRGWEGGRVGGNEVVKEDGRERVRKREDTEEGGRKGGKPLLHTTAASYVELLIFRFQACSDWKEAVMNCVGNHSTTPLLPVTSFPPALPSLYHFITSSYYACI